MADTPVVPVVKKDPDPVVKKDFLEGEVEDKFTTEKILDKEKPVNEIPVVTDFVPDPNVTAYVGDPAPVLPLVVGEDSDLTKPPWNVPVGTIQGRYAPGYVAPTDEEIKAERAARKA